MKAAIALARGAQSFYTIFQFLVIYGLLNSSEAAPYSLALAFAGLVPLADLTLSVNASAYRLEMTESSRIVLGRVLALLPIFSFSAALISVAYYVYSGDGARLGAVDASLFLFALALFNAISAALPLFSLDPARYGRLLVMVGAADIALISLSAVLFLTNSLESLAAMVIGRLSLLLAVTIAASGGLPRFRQVADGARWWVSAIKRRRRFLAQQLASSFAGTLLYTVPPVLLFARVSDSAFVDYTMAVGVTNFIVVFLSASFASHTGTLLGANERVQNARALPRAVLAVPLVVAPYFVPIALAAVAALAVMRDYAPVEALARIGNIPLSLVGLALVAGFCNLCAQVLAFGQRLDGNDHFMVPALVLGAMNVALVATFGRTTYVVALVSVTIAMVGFAIGVANTRRAAKRLTTRDALSPS